VEFMSADHVEAMNTLLAGSAEVTAAAKDLPREYVLAYALTDGPDDGETVHWQMRFSPSGTAFALTPATDADLVLRGDWRTALTAFAASKGGETVADAGLSAEGDYESFMTAVGAQFAVALKVAAIRTEFPV
jgi:hypothetical protein